MTTIVKSLPATGAEIPIIYNTTVATIVQNLGNGTILWSATSGSDAWHLLDPRDFIRVDFDVYMKSPTKQAYPVCITQ
jgi:hypothetical protein